MANVLEGFTLLIEEQPELLRKYGLATALLASADHMLREMIRLFGGLQNVKAGLVHEMLSKKTFGAKIPLAKQVVDNQALFAQLEQSVKDRNLLAHSVTVKKGEAYGLLSGSKFHELNEGVLDDIIERARKLTADMANKIHSTFPFIKP